MVPHMRSSDVPRSHLAPLTRGIFLAAQLPAPRTAAARHVYAVLDDPEGKNSKLFVKAKNNLARDTKALRYGMGAIRRMHISSPSAPIGGTDCHDINRQRVAGCRRIGGISQRICRRPCN